MKANDSFLNKEFIEVVVQWWCMCVKLGMARLARLICDMSLALNRDSKKRSVPNFLLILLKLMKIMFSN